MLGTPAPRPASASLGWDGAVVAALGVAALAMAPLLAGPWRGVVSVDLLQNLALLLQGCAVVVVLAISLRHDVDPAGARAWRRMAFAFATLMGADLLWAALGEPALSVADVPNTAFYPLALWSVLSLPTVRSTSRQRFWLDSSVVVLGVGTLVWYFVLAPTISEAARSHEALLTTVVNASYPVWDVVLLFGACAALWREPLHGGRRALLWVAAAMVVQGATDLAYDAASRADTFEAGTLLDVGWLLAYVAVAAAAVTYRRDGIARGGEALRPESTATHFMKELLPYGAVVVSYLTLIVAIRHVTHNNDHLDLLGALVGTGVVTALVSVRQMHAMRENARLTREHALRESEYRVSALVRHSSDALLVVAVEGEVRFSSPSALMLFATDDAGGVQGRALVDVVADEARDDVGAFLAAVREAGSARAVWRLRPLANGAPRYAEVVGSDLLAEPAVGGIVLNVRDVTERTALESQLAYLAYHDALTGLVNRTRFHERVAAALAESAELPADDAPRPAVLFVDLDDFKLVNDSLGHAAGDRLLKLVADRMLSATRGCDTVARLGGDEFAVLLAGVQIDREAEVVATRIVAAMRAPFLVDGSEVYVPATIGIALAGFGGRGDVDELLRRADVAMYHAKRSGKGRFVVFSETMAGDAPRQLAIEADLHNALARGELFLEYQPIVGLRDGAVRGAEALLRWQHPERGRVSPLEFVPIAEQKGLIVPIGRWVLEEACRQAAAWCAAADAPATFYVSVNVSSRQLAEVSLVDDVVRALEQSGLPASRLLLEITESAIVEDGSQIRDTFDALKALGLRLAVDDFGTGYSSLAYLQRFPIDVLKIDRAFVSTLGRAESQSSLARAVIGLGDALGLETIAEGVETKLQQEQLRALGCGLAQGFGFHRPLAATAFERLLQRETADEPAGR